MKVSISTAVIWSFIVLLIAINIISFVSGQSYIAVVSGSSMEPILSTGDVVFISPARSPS